VNIEKEILAHSDWKRKLSNYITKPDGSLKSSDVASDRNCELGKWIYGSSEHSNGPEFNKLKADHARFHTAAAGVIRRADAGQNVAEEVLLGSNSEYGRASSDVVSSLMALKAK
jgi:hypothetical protein